tara:strand:- start:631 stop:924 length:294 start_codon:yes stop_codon:yes gene_type:complete
MAAIFFSFFILALSYNLLRECPTICGCFDTHASGRDLTVDEKYAKMGKEIVLDCCLVVAALYVLCGTLGCCGASSCSGAAAEPAAEEPGVEAGGSAS